MHRRFLETCCRCTRIAGLAPPAARWPGQGIWYLCFVTTTYHKGFKDFKPPSEMHVAHIAATRSLRCSHIADHARERAWHGSGDRRGLREPRSKILARRALSFEQLLSINDACWRHACTWLMSYCLGLSVKCQDVLYISCRNSMTSSN